MKQKQYRTKNKIKTIAFYGIVAVLILIFYAQIINFLEVFVNGLFEIIQEYAIPIVVIGIPLILLINKDLRKENKRLKVELKKVRDASLVIWNQYNRDKKWQEEDLDDYIHHLNQMDEYMIEQEITKD